MKVNCWLSQELLEWNVTGRALWGQEGLKSIYKRITVSEERLLFQESAVKRSREIERWLKEMWDQEKDFLKEKFCS